MDGAAGEALIQKVINDLVNKLVEECAHFFYYESNIQNVEAKVEQLLTVEGEVELGIVAARREAKVIGPSINRWKDKTAELKSEADKVLKGANKVNGGCMKGHLNVLQRFLLSRKAAQLTVNIDEILKQVREHIKLEHGPVPAGLLPASSANCSQDPESRISITNQVMTALEKVDIYMIGICGMVGVGKTRLADEVKRRVIDEKLFDAAVKVVVSGKPNLDEIQGVIAKNLGLELEEPDRDGRARKLLHRLNDGSKNLVILDDVCEPIKLHEIGIPVEQVRCKVVFTSQNNQLMKAQENILVETLSTDEARLLFKNIAPKYHGAIVNEVADECGGLPLLIDTVASALEGRDLEVWQSALYQLKKSPVTNDMTKLAYTRITLSYDLLKSNRPQAQPLLLLCCLFPERADIPFEKLVRFAKGLHSTYDCDNLVNTSNRVYELLDDLKNCSLLLPGDKEMTVKMNHVIRDVCLSISSKEDEYYNYKVEHQSQMENWPNNGEQKPYTAISLTFGNQMQQLPHDLVYPYLELLQLQFHGDSLNIPADFFEGMENIRVLDIKRTALWRQFIKIDAVPQSLEFLKNLRTLSLEFCDLSAWDLSLIDSLKYLEVLSFFSSKLLNLPSQIQQLSNLQLLDLRCAVGPTFIPNNLLSALTKLEYLYLGNYDFWSDPREESDERKGICITELSSVSLLKVLQVRVKDPLLLLELKDQSLFERLKNFQIEAIRKVLSFREYQIGKSITLDGIDWDSFVHAKIFSLLSTTECLALKQATGFRNLFGVCSNLRTLDLYDCDKVEFIMDAGDLVEVDALNKLKNVEIKSMEDLQVICKGDLPRKSLIELETVKLDDLPKLTLLWSAPIGSGCLVNLRVLEMSCCDAITFIFPYTVAKGLEKLQKLDIKSCDSLEWIVFNEGGGGGAVAENILFQNLSFLSLDDLPKFRSFFLDSSPKALSSTVEENSLASEKTTQGCGWIYRKKRAPPSTTGELPLITNLHPDLEVPALHSDDENVESTIQRIFNQEVELPSMNKLLVRCMNMEHLVDDQTHLQLVSKVRNMYVDSCKKLLNVAESDSIRALQNLELVDIRNCESMEVVFDFGRPNIEIPNADPVLSKLEIISLVNLKSLKHVLGTLPEGTTCFGNLRSLEISGCCSLDYVFSVSVAKMLGNLHDLTIKGPASMENIIKIDGGFSEVTDKIQFPRLRDLRLDNLDCLKSFSSGNHDFNFPQLRNLLVRECPRMNTFCQGQVTARYLTQVRVGDHNDQQVSIKDGLNRTIQQLNGYSVESASGEIVEE